MNLSFFASAFEGNIMNSICVGAVSKITDDTFQHKNQNSLNRNRNLLSFVMKTVHTNLIEWCENDVNVCSVVYLCFRRSCCNYVTYLHLELFA